MGATLSSNVGEAAEISVDGEVVSLRVARVGGRYALIGNINLDLAGPIDPGNAVRFSKTITAISVYEQWVIPRALDFLVRTKERYPFDKIISHTFPLEDINKAFDILVKGEAGRIVLEMDHDL